MHRSPLNNVKKIDALDTFGGHNFTNNARRPREPNITQVRSRYFHHTRVAIFCYSKVPHLFQLRGNGPSEDHPTAEEAAEMSDTITVLAVHGFRRSREEIARLGGSFGVSDIY